MTEQQFELHTVQPDSRPTLLAVLAHPDDESFGMGGTLAFYASCGAAVHLICVTGGELGAMSAELLVGYNSAADRRYAELKCAAAQLGLASVTMLGYRDSGMPGAESNSHPEALAAAPLDDVTAQVTDAIQRLRPQVVVTFDPIGGYRHPDHLAIQQATVAAFHATRDPARFASDHAAYQPQKLYFHTFSRRLLRVMVRLLPLSGRDPRRFGDNGDVDLTSLATEDFPIHAEIDVLTTVAARTKAGRCHASQGGGPAFSRGLLGVVFRLLTSHESFMRAYPEPTPGLHERDLFAGVIW